MNDKVKEVKGFKIGDIVTGKSTWQWLQYYYAEIISFNEKGKAILKKVKDLGTDKFDQWTDNTSWYVDDLTLVKVEKTKSNNHNQIKHIITGNKTIVIIPQQDGTYKKGEATCHENDTFSEYEGLRIALARAYGVEPFEKEENDVIKYKVGQKVSKYDAIKIIEAGGHIKKDDNLTYYKKDGKLVFDDRDTVANISGGYNGNFYEDDLYIINTLPNNTNKLNIMNFSNQELLEEVTRRLK